MRVCFANSAGYLAVLVTRLNLPLTTKIRVRTHSSGPSKEINDGCYLIHTDRCREGSIKGTRRLWYAALSQHQLSYHPMYVIPRWTT